MKAGGKWLWRAREPRGGGASGWRGKAVKGQSREAGTMRDLGL